jgi:hypothetical protein
LLAFPLVIYLWKVIVWDKVLGLGTTDPITGMVADWIGTIITAYVGGRSIEKVARISKGDRVPSFANRAIAIPHCNGNFLMSGNGNRTKQA